MKFIYLFTFYCFVLSRVAGPYCPVILFQPKTKMSALGNENLVNKQLQQDLQNELNTTNQLLRLISVELQQIKHITRPSGEFEANILKNTSLIKALGKLQQVDLENLPAFTRKQIDMHVDHNVANEEHNTSRNDNELEESQ